jgi:dTDP-4-dehydrorhamnose reductase
LAEEIRDKKSVSKVMRQLDERSRKIHAVKDKMGTPKYAPALAKIPHVIVETGCLETYHLACKMRATRHDVTKHVMGTLGRKDVELKAVSVDLLRQGVLRSVGHDAGRFGT